MTKEFVGSGDYAVATLQANIANKENVAADGYYHVVCRDVNGNIKWEDGFENQVVQQGKILAMNNTFFSATAIVGPYLGLIGTYTGFSATDTWSSHTDWTEFTAYTISGSLAQRPVAVFTTATGNNSTAAGTNIVSSAANAVTYTIAGAGGTVNGCFLLTGTGATAAFTNTTSGTLWSAGLFSVGKITTAGDTVTVTYTTTATS